MPYTGTELKELHKFYHAFRARSSDLEALVNQTAH